MKLRSTPPPRNGKRLRSLKPYLCCVMLCMLAFMLSLIMGRLPHASATGFTPGTLATLQNIQAVGMIYPGYSDYPPISGSISASSKYIPPQVWNQLAWDTDNDGELDANEVITYVPVTVNISGGLADQDSYWWMEQPNSYFQTGGLINTADLDMSEGYTDTQQWNGASITGQFSTSWCMSQTAILSTNIIYLTADDNPAYYADDSPFLLMDSINVVLPNAATITWASHNGNPHIVDTWTHSAFFKPEGVALPSPATSVVFNTYEVQEGDWSVDGVNTAQGLDEQEVRDWVSASKDGWNGSDLLDGSNNYIDNNQVNRWLVGVNYPSFHNPGEIRLDQGWRVTKPIIGDYWYNIIEYHFLDISQDQYNPGECHVRKEGDSKTSTAKVWSECSYHNSLWCPY